MAKRFQKFNFTTWQWEYEPTGDPLGTFEQLGKGILAGPIANRPAAGIADRLYVSTDEAIVYRDNGSAWQVFLTEDLVTISGVSPTDGTILVGNGTAFAGEPFYGRRFLKSSSFTASQQGTYIFSGGAANITASLPALSGVSDGFTVRMINLDPTYHLSVAPNGTDTLMGNNATVRMLPAGLSARCTLVASGSDWQLVDINPQPFFTLRMGTAQSIAPSTDTVLDLSNADVDPWGFADTANDKWVPLIPGYYGTSLSVKMLDALTNGERMFVHVNINAASSGSAHNFNNATLGTGTTANGITNYMNGSSDYFTASAFHSSTVSRRINNDTNTFLVGQRRG